MNKKEFENNKVFKLQYGYLFTNNNIIIDNIGFIYDKECGCILNKNIILYKIKGGINYVCR